MQNSDGVTVHPCPVALVEELQPDHHWITNTRFPEFPAVVGGINPGTYKGDVAVIETGLWPFALEPDSMDTTGLRPELRDAFLGWYAGHRGWEVVIAVELVAAGEEKPIADAGSCLRPRKRGYVREVSGLGIEAHLQRTHDVETWEALFVGPQGYHVAKCNGTVDECLTALRAAAKRERDRRDRQREMDFQTRHIDFDDPKQVEAWATGKAH